MSSSLPAAVPEIPVRHIDEAVAYYQQCLGFARDWRAEDLGLAGISNGNCRMFLANQDYRKGYGNVLRVFYDFATAERLAANGADR